MNHGELPWTNRNWWTKQINQSIKLANQRRTPDSNGKDNSSYFWDQKISWSLKHRNKRRSIKCFDLSKDMWKVKNTLLPWILQNILENQRTAKKFIMADFYEMNFIKGIAILAKVDEMYNILKSLVFGRVMKMELNDQGFF